MYENENRMQTVKHPNIKPFYYPGFEFTVYLPIKSNSYLIVRTYKYTSMPW